MIEWNPWERSFCVGTDPYITARTFNRVTSLKGGKGVDAYEIDGNGDNERIIIEDCIYGFCHGCLTCGSESLHNKNVIIRRIKVGSGYNFLWLKMRPDTYQHYEYITAEDIEGEVNNFVNINPWTQFFDLKGREMPAPSKADHVTVRNCKVKCLTAFSIREKEDEYSLSDFTFENIELDAKNKGNSDFAKRMNSSNVKV